MITQTQLNELMQLHNASVSAAEDAYRVTYGVGTVEERDTAWTKRGEASQEFVNHLYLMLERPSWVKSVS